MSDALCTDGINRWMPACPDSQATAMRGLLSTAAAQNVAREIFVILIFTGRDASS